LYLVDGKMQYLFDESGRRYLDAFGCIATVSCGHCHPQVLEAIINQTTKLQHTTALYLNRPIVDFAEALASKTPGDLNVVFFTNSGTEANELALLIARLGRIAGFISEAIQGVGGIYELAPGSHFWGFEAQGVVPDIITLAK
nr:putative aminotransferase class III superfamily protein [Tanacetum cinerariifolium]